MRGLFFRGRGVKRSNFLPLLRGERKRDALEKGVKAPIRRSCGTKSVNNVKDKKDLALDYDYLRRTRTAKAPPSFCIGGTSNHLDDHHLLLLVDYLLLPSFV